VSYTESDGPGCKQKGDPDLQFESKRKEPRREPPNDPKKPPIRQPPERRKSPPVEDPTDEPDQGDPKPGKNRPIGDPPAKKGPKRVVPASSYMRTAQYVVRRAGMFVAPKNIARKNAYPHGREGKPCSGNYTE
jgi:hypothetical protein